MKLGPAGVVTFSQVDLRTLHETGLPALFELSPRTFVPDHCVK